MKRLVAALFIGLGAAVACVPSGSAPPYDAGSTSPTAAPTYKPSIDVLTAPFEDDFNRAEEPAIAPSASASAHPAAHEHEAGAGVDAHADALADAHAEAHAEAHEEDAGADAEAHVPSNLGPNWIQAKTNAWRVENGKLCGQGAHNHGVWLNKTLPINARIEFDAVSSSDDGDLKCEVWGDGHSYAKGTSYSDATSYLTILGGWKNTLHVLARLNEHGQDRKELPVDKTSDDPRQRPVQKGQVYHFKVERTDGKTIRFFVDGNEILKWTDPNPLLGQGHDHFAFNEWEAKVCFDNFKVTPLP